MQETLNAEPTLLEPETLSLIPKGRGPPGAGWVS